MAVDYQANARTAHIALTGSLDVNTRADVESLLPDPATIERLIIDCSQVAIMESSILTVLMRYRRRWEELGRDPFDMVIVASPGVRRVFEITGLNRAMTVVNGGEKRQP